MLDVTEQNIYDLVKRKRLVMVEDNGRKFISPSALVVYIQSRVNELKKFEKALRKLQNTIDK